MTKTDLIRSYLERGLDLDQISKATGMRKTRVKQFVRHIKEREALRDIREKEQGYRTFDRFNKSAID
jgi:DNA-binding transcriptional regulator GbsR (MarR family)